MCVPLGHLVLEEPLALRVHHLPLEKKRFVCLRIHLFGPSSYVRRSLRCRSCSTVFFENLVPCRAHLWLHDVHVHVRVLNLDHVLLRLPLQRYCVRLYLCLGCLGFHLSDYQHRTWSQGLFWTLSISRPGTNSSTLTPLYSNTQ